MINLGKVYVDVITDVGEVIDELRRISIELQRLQDASPQPVMLDRLAPTVQEWIDAPSWADYHTVDQSGAAIWWSSAGIVLGADAWYHDADTMGQWERDSRVYDLTGLHWEESLRVRP